MGSTKRSDSVQGLYRHCDQEVGGGPQLELLGVESCCN